MAIATKKPKSSFQFLFTFKTTPTSLKRRSALSEAVAGAYAVYFKRVGFGKAEFRPRAYQWAYLPITNPIIAKLEALEGGTPKDKR